MVRPSSLSIVLFRRKGWGPERYLEWSHELLRSQVAFVTPTKWEGETVGRMAFLHPNSTEQMVREILASTRRLGTRQQRGPRVARRSHRARLRLRQAIPPSASSTIRLPRYAVISA